ncbi:zeta-sarcoglycan-like, partial [Tropilaelaps mercedesae]
MSTTIRCEQAVGQLKSNGQVTVGKEDASIGGAIVVTGTGRANGRQPTTASSASSLLTSKSTTTLAFHLLVTLTVTVVCANLAMNIFLIRVLQLNRAGMSSVKFSASSGIWLRDHAIFADLLRTTRLTHVNYNQEQSNGGLLMSSGKDVHIESNNRAGRVNSLSLSNGRLEARGDAFEVLADSNSDRKVLFRADRDEVVVAAGEVPVSAPNGFNIRGSLQANTVRGSPQHDLRLESPLNEVNIRSDGELVVESKAEHINVKSVNTVNILSQDGTIVLNSQKLEIKDLPIVAVRSVRVRRDSDRPNEAAE